CFAAAGCVDWPANFPAYNRNPSFRKSYLLARPNERNGRGLYSRTRCGKSLRYKPRAFYIVAPGTALSRGPVSDVPNRREVARAGLRCAGILKLVHSRSSGCSRFEAPPAARSRLIPETNVSPCFRRDVETTRGGQRSA